MLSATVNDVNGVLCIEIDGYRELAGNATEVLIESLQSEIVTLRKNIRIEFERSNSLRFQLGIKEVELQDAKKDRDHWRHQSYERSTSEKLAKEIDFLNQDNVKLQNELLSEIKKGDVLAYELSLIKREHDPLKNQLDEAVKTISLARSYFWEIFKFPQPKSDNPCSPG